MGAAVCLNAHSQSYGADAADDHQTPGETLISDRRTAGVRQTSDGFLFRLIRYDGAERTSVDGGVV
jgi:hypothetical protein